MMRLLGVAVLALWVVGGSAVGGNAPVTWLLFVDDLHLDFRNTGRIRSALRVAIATLVAKGDSMTATSTGPSSLSVSLTTDRSVLDRAMKNVSGNALKPGDMIEPPGLAESGYRARLALNDALEFLDATKWRDPSERRVLIIVSNGYLVDRLSLGEEISRVARAASSLGVTIFAIDPGHPLEVLDPRFDASTWHAHLTERRRSLMLLTESTLGFVSAPGMDYAAAVRAIDATIRN